VDVFHITTACQSIPAHGFDRGDCEGHVPAVWFADTEEHTRCSTPIGDCSSSAAVPQAVAQVHRNVDGNPYYYFCFPLALANTFQLCFVRCDEGGA
jgi:hypothetical protein